MFTSDNGADWKPEDKAKFTHRANANWRGEKADTWDGGHRIPFIARWPGQIRPGSVSNQLGCLTDFMATAAAVTGYCLPRGVAEDSFNLLPAIKAEAKAPIRDSVVHHSSLGMFAFREGHWKLIPQLGSGGFSSPHFEQPKPTGPKGQLYNLQDDPAESRNLWLERPDMVRRLTALLERIQRDGFSRPI
jgi:arylsulfatase A